MIENLKNKRIIVGVTGSIAAYKSPNLVREIVKSGGHVHVVMTPSSTKFVAPMALTSVSKNPVAIEMFDENLQNGGAWHVQLAHWADLMIVAPCSATTLSKLAMGLTDSALVCVAHAMPRSIPLIVAPAMDYTMWLHPSTQRNLEIVRSYGAHIIYPEDGELASGLKGPGRLPDLPVLMQAISDVLAGKPITQSPYSSSATEHADYTIDNAKIKAAAEQSSNPLAVTIEKDKFNAELELSKLKDKLSGNDSSKKLAGKKVLITAGPTYEKIDDVRFIANYSSGKMGYALAKAARDMGADVCLVSGPVSLSAPEGVRTIMVSSAEQMYNAAVFEYPDTDIAIMSAAVADFTPASPAQGKIKKTGIEGNSFSIELVKTKDILASLGKTKTDKQLLVGFALESVNEIEYGKKKLNEKNCDFVVVNSAVKPDSGFGGDNNTITILDKNGTATNYEPMSKELCAINILNKISEKI